MTKNTRFKNNSLANKAIYSKFNKRFLFLLCIACTFVLLTPLASLATTAKYSFLNAIPTRENLNIANITQVLTILMLVSIFLERAIEIIVQALNIPKALNKESIEESSELKKSLIPLITVFLGGIISLIGIRGLEPFFNLEAPGVDSNLFRAMDIALTGVLISGGTDGIHKILTSLTAFLDVNKASSEKATAENKQVKSEVDKITSENKQAQSETDKITSANKQVQSETDKITSANKQVQSEADKITAENERVAVAHQLETERQRQALEKMQSENKR